MEQQESLNLNDLKLMAQIIKVVSTRGAIQADEMAPVGLLFTKLVAFIKAAEPADDKSENNTSTEEVKTPEGN